MLQYFFWFGFKSVRSCNKVISCALSTLMWWPELAIYGRSVLAVTMLCTARSLTLDTALYGSLCIWQGTSKSVHTKSADCIGTEDARDVTKRKEKHGIKRSIRLRNFHSKWTRMIRMWGGVGALTAVRASRLREKSFRLMRWIYFSHLRMGKSLSTDDAPGIKLASSPQNFSKFLKPHVVISHALLIGVWYVNASIALQKSSLSR